MRKSLTQTVRIIRPSRVATDARGGTVWDGPVEETENRKTMVPGGGFDPYNSA
jgi:hypothetical protein